MSATYKTYYYFRAHRLHLVSRTRRRMAIRNIPRIMMNQAPIVLGMKMMMSKNKKNKRRPACVAKKPRNSVKKITYKSLLSKRMKILEKLVLILMQ
jgi:hypothetical protein